MVHSFRPGITSTFQEYAEHSFIPYILSCLQSVSRLDVVWDIYKPDSLKLDTQKRGECVRQHVAFTSKIPGNWYSFLRVDANKTELFSLLAEQIQSIMLMPKKYFPHFERMCSALPSAIIHRRLLPAHTKRLIHAFLSKLLMSLIKNSNESWFAKVTVDSIVVVIAVSCFHDVCLDELWISLLIYYDTQVHSCTFYSTLAQRSLELC